MHNNSSEARLVLMYPGWKKFGTTFTAKPGTLILHSRADYVVPYADSEELVKNSKLPASALIEVGNDHRLADSGHWKQCCERDSLRDGEWHSNKRVISPNMYRLEQIYPTIIA